MRLDFRKTMHMCEALNLFAEELEHLYSINYPGVAFPYRMPYFTLRGSDAYLGALGNFAYAVRSYIGYFVNHARYDSFAEMAEKEGTYLYWTYDDLCDYLGEPKYLNYNKYLSSGDREIMALLNLFPCKLIAHLDKLIQTLRYRPFDNSFWQRDLEVRSKYAYALVTESYMENGEVISNYSTRAGAENALHARLKEEWGKTDWKLEGVYGNGSENTARLTVWKNKGNTDIPIAVDGHVELIHSRYRFALKRAAKFIIIGKPENGYANISKPDTSKYDPDGFYPMAESLEEGKCAVLGTAEIPPSENQEDYKWTQWYGGVDKMPTLPPLPSEARSFVHCRWWGIVPPGGGGNRQLVICDLRHVPTEDPD